MIYFTAIDGEAVGVYAVSAQGGDVQTLLTGEPLLTPQGLAISSDGQTLFVADRGAGQVWSIPSAGGSAAVLAGTEGTAPVSVEVKAEASGDMVYFSGSRDGTPGVWKVAAAGGAAASVAQGAPLVNPMGVAIADDGTVYVVDHDASGQDSASVFRIKGGQVETIANHFRAGHLAGAALTQDNGALLVSALNAPADAAQVLLIKLASLEKGIVDKVISANLGSGGVHRAHNLNIFSWADYQRPLADPQNIQKPGHVYVVQP
jgi:DNA-binding beta-propeller fold protein YncE